MQVANQGACQSQKTAKNSDYEIPVVVFPNQELVPNPNRIWEASPRTDLSFRIRLVGEIADAMRQRAEAVAATRQEIGDRRHHPRLSKAMWRRVRQAPTRSPGEFAMLPAFRQRGDEPLEPSPGISGRAVENRTPSSGGDRPVPDQSSRGLQPSVLTRRRQPAGSRNKARPDP